MKGLILKNILLIITVILIDCSFINAQGVESGKIFVGPSIETSIPVGKLAVLGFAAGGEYMVGDNFGVLFDFSIITYHEESSLVHTSTMDLSVVAPCLFLSYHFNDKSTWDPFIALGVGYSIVNGSVSSPSGGSSSFFDKPQKLIIPQLKIGLRYWVTEQWAVRGNIGFYRALSAGFDYTL